MGSIQSARVIDALNKAYNHDCTRIKYPKTMHLPWSENLQNDDREIETLEHLQGQMVVMTEKMDGENTTLYRDGYHARSVDSLFHPSQSHLKALHATICSDLPEGTRICGENVYARHSIAYEDLETSFFVFGTWHLLYCDHWAVTEDMCSHLNLLTVPVMCVDKFETVVEYAKSLPESWFENHEGYVIRTLDGFHHEEFQYKVAKYVRKNHVQTNEHWKRNWVPNKFINL